MFFFSFIMRLTVHWTPPQVLSHLPLQCSCRRLLRTQTCCPRIHSSAVKIHGGMVLHGTPLLHIQRANNTFRSNGWISSEFTERLGNNSSKWQESITRFASKILRFPRIHSKAGTTRKEWRFGWRISRWTRRVLTDRSTRWRWCPCRLLVDSRWLHLSSSLWISSSTLCAERSNISSSTEIYWRDQSYLYKSGRVRLLERWCGSKFIRFLERIHGLHFIERSISKGISVVWRKTYKNSSNCQTWEFVAWSLVQNGKSRSDERKARMGKRETKAR